MAWAAAISAGAQAGGALVGGVSAYQQSRGQARTLRHYGDAQQQDRLKQGQRLLAAQRVAFAKSGVDPNTGSALDVGTATAEEEALAAKREKDAYDAAARNVKLQGQAALLSGLLLGGASAAQTVGGPLGAGIRQRLTS